MKYEAVPVQAVPDPAGPLRPGAVLDRYTVLGELGSGGMGVVYSAYDPDLDRRIALKILHHPVRPAGATATLTVGGSDAQRSRLLREAQGLARLDHRNVVKIHDIGAHQDHFFLAMELVEGQTLRTWLEEPRSWREVVDVMCDAGLGLAAVHEAGLVHRDVKPENIVIRHDGRVVVMDFGLARALEQTPAEPNPTGAGSNTVLASPLTRAGQVIGTPAYIAPERFGGTDDARADQFAFCVTLYEALHGLRPFAGDTIGELTRAASNGDIQPPPPGCTVPSWVQRIVVRGLAPDPADRFPSMTDLLARLGRDRRPRWRVVLAGAAVAAALVAVAGVVVQQHRAREQLCAGADTRLGEIWNAARQKTIEASFLATGAAYAPSAWRATQAAVDAYAAQWRGMYHDACAATHFRGVQSHELLDVRMACLERGRRELDTALQMLESADAELVSGAVKAVYGLRRIAACGELEKLTRRSSREPASRVRAEAAQRSLAEARALYDAGKLRASLSLAEAAADEAAAAGDPTTRAEALVLAGGLHRRFADSARAERILLEAVVAAEGAADEQLRGKAYGQLHRMLVVTPTRSEEGARWGRLADATVEIAGPNTELAAYLANLHGVVAWSRADYDGALRHFEETVEVRRALFGGEHPLVGVALSNVALIERTRGNLDAALSRYLPAVEIVERAYGPEHPDVALTLNSLGLAWLDDGRADEALASLERALAIFRKAHGESHPDVAQSTTNVAMALRALGRTDEALATSEVGLALSRDINGDRHPETARAQVELGLTQVAAGRDAEAMVTLRRALAATEAVHGPRAHQTAWALNAIGALLALRGESTAALRAFDQSIDRRRAAIGDDPMVGETHCEAAAVLHALGRADAARARYAQARRVLEASAGSRKWLIACAWIGLAKLDLAAGREARAIELLERTTRATAETRGRARRAAAARFALAQALAHDDPRRAEGLAREARSLLTGPATREVVLRREVESWLKTR